MACSLAWALVVPEPLMPHGDNWCGSTIRLWQKNAPEQIAASTLDRASAAGGHCSAKRNVKHWELG